MFNYVYASLLKQIVTSNTHACFHGSRSQYQHKLVIRCTNLTQCCLKL